ncbi:MAG: NADH-quinone oxidoreductase subunit N [Myxococcales bacterium]|nr:NADH-quinone oxidoreductase subunit N [Myxococcales bacterium]
MPKDLLLFGPELMLLGGALLVFIASIAKEPKSEATWGMALLASFAAVGLSLLTLHERGAPFFPGIYRVDLFSQLLKLGLSALLCGVILISRNLPSVRPSARVDAPLFLLLSTVGMMMLVSATELLTMYVSLELSAYGLYIAVALSSKPRGSEAAAKYVLFGATSSAITLYGLSLVYGTVGSTSMVKLSGALVAGADPLLMIGMLLMFAGLLFKLALVPFHYWAPDAYEGAPHQMVAFIASVSKLGAVGIVARFAAMLPGGDSATLFIALSVASMALGNLAALAQTDLKRLIAYSAVAHAGYLMLGYAAMSKTGLAAVIFYGMIYGASSVLAFVVLSALGRDGENPTMESISGLYQRSPLAALMMLVAIFTLAGIPPTAGFIGKWYLFAAALQRGQFWLVLVAAAASTVALYYYLQVVKAMYLAPPEDRPRVELTFTDSLAGLAALGFVIFYGVYPAPLWELAQKAAALLG